MLLSEPTRTKLIRIQRELCREFPHIPQEHIAYLMRTVTSDLVELARFDDFVPLLIHRRMRERLVAQAGLVTSEAAS